jgi:hypothetical protein
MGFCDCRGFVVSKLQRDGDIRYKIVNFLPISAQRRTILVNARSLVRTAAVGPSKLKNVQ